MRPIQMGVPPSQKASNSLFGIQRVLGKESLRANLRCPGRASTRRKENVWRLSNRTRSNDRFKKKRDASKNSGNGDASAVFQICAYQEPWQDTPKRSKAVVDLMEGCRPTGCTAGRQPPCRAASIVELDCTSRGNVDASVLGCINQPYQLLSPLHAEIRLEIKFDAECAIRKKN